MDNLEESQLNQGILCEVESTEYGTIVSFPAELHLQELGPLQLYAEQEGLTFSFQNLIKDEKVIYPSQDEEPNQDALVKIELIESAIDEMDEEFSLNLKKEDEECSVKAYSSDVDVCLNEFPELGSVVELESEVNPEQDHFELGEHDEMIGRRLSYDFNNFNSNFYCGEKWGVKKIKALLTIMRKHQHKFKNGFKQRISLWSEISKELVKQGFLNVDRDECSKKWDNLFRTYKKVNSRDQDNATWELYEPVKEVVKCLHWPKEQELNNKRHHEPCIDENILEKLLELSNQQSKRISACTQSFILEARQLEKERYVLIKTIEKHLLPKTARID